MSEKATKKNVISIISTLYRVSYFIPYLGVIAIVRLPRFTRRALALCKVWWTYTKALTTASRCFGVDETMLHADGKKSGTFHVAGPSRSNLNVNSLPTWNNAVSDQSPNQFKTQRLNRAGDVAALSFSPSEDGFMVNTTCKFFITCPVNHLYSSSFESNIRPSRWAPSLHWVIRVVYSSPEKSISVK